MSYHGKQFHNIRLPYPNYRFLFVFQIVRLTLWLVKKSVSLPFQTNLFVFLRTRVHFSLFILFLKVAFSKGQFGKCISFSACIFFKNGTFLELREYSFLFDSVPQIFLLLTGISVLTRSSLADKNIFFLDFRRIILFYF